MTGQEIRRADELLTELVELVETARSVPISGSCVIPRERALDLLDDLRDALPPEIAEARRVIELRDELLITARAEAAALRQQVGREAEAHRAGAVSAARDYRAAAEQRSADLVEQARAEAARLVERGEVENARLISATGVHQAATSAAELVRQDIDDYATAVRVAADEYAAATRSAADEYAETSRSAADEYNERTRREVDHYAVRLRVDAEDYAERTLSEVAATLSRSAATAERGRAELAGRRSAPLGPSASRGPAPGAGSVRPSDPSAAGRVTDRLDPGDNDLSGSAAPGSAAREMSDAQAPR